MPEKKYNFLSSDIAMGIVEVLPIGIVTYSVDTGNCLYINQAALDIIGAKRKQALAQNFRKIEAWKHSGLIDMAEEAIKTGKVQKKDVHLITTFNKNIYIKTFFITYSSNSENFLLLLFDEITDIKIKELENKDQMLFLRSLLEAIPNPIFFKDIKGVYRGCNDAFTKFLGKKREEIIDHTAYDIAPKDLAEIYHKADLDLINSKTNQTYEADVQGLDGERRKVIFNKAVYYDTEHNPNGLVGVILDITERKKIEAELKEKYEELKHMNEFMIDRENKMVELKNELKKLKGEK
jgi:PAS domain S-box-containing protein